MEGDRCDPDLFAFTDATSNFSGGESGCCASPAGALMMPTASGQASKTTGLNGTQNSSAFGRASPCRGWQEPSIPCSVLGLPSLSPAPTILLSNQIPRKKPCDLQHLVVD